MVFIQDGYLKTDAPQLDNATRSRQSAFQSMNALSAMPNEYGLLTDLYQLTMSACYVGESLHQKPASFELFTRRLPEGFGYLIAMGLEQGLAYLQHLSFSAEQILQLQKTQIFSDAPDSFWALLENFRFEGDVWAVPEGTAIFANEPMLRIEAPLWQAQIAETYLLNTLNYQTLWPRGRREFGRWRDPMRGCSSLGRGGRLVRRGRYGRLGLRSQVDSMPLPMY